MNLAYRDRFALIWAFMRTRWGLRFKTRHELLDYQKRHIDRFIKRSALRSVFYRPTAHLGLDRQPIVDKKTVLRSFSAFNTAQVDLMSAQNVAYEAERQRDFEPTLPDGVTVGSSSGTSGQPSVFLVSSRERSIWAGVILARMLTTPLLRRVLNPLARSVKIAFFLRANSNLYLTLRSSRIQFEFFDMIRLLDTHSATLSRYAPDILVAPPSILQQLATLQADRNIDIRPSQVISVAETLEEWDVKTIRSAWSIIPQQIYQCTEGFLGYSCAFESIHLNEEFIHVELDPLPASSDRFTAIITDFSRTTQLFIRYRMDDVLHLDPSPCPCGRLTLRLKAIEGRQDEVLWFPNLATEVLKPVFPDQLRRVMMLALPGADYRLEQIGPILQVAISGQEANYSADWASVEHELNYLWQTLAIRPPRLLRMAFPQTNPLSKRRRIRCINKPAGTVSGATESLMTIDASG